MSCINSDLEEGEILDDSPSSPLVTVKKDRDLPRRYILRENKSIHKHKKDCKYAIRYHAKKLAKLKKTPSRVSSKKHRKSCPHDRSNKLNIKYDSPITDHLIKNGQSFSKQSLISEINCSFKDLLIKKQNLNPNRCNSQISEPKIKPAHNLSTPESREICKNNELETKSTNNSLSDSRRHDEYYSEKSESLPHLKVLDKSSNIKDAAVVFHGSPKAHSEESEDEEELRRIALATCAKRKLIPESYENVSNNNSNISLPESSIAETQIITCETSNLVSDNYEVVDMEVDEDTENSVEILDNERLFIIDTKPTSKLVGNNENSISESQHIGNSSDDDFEADILRAELIGSMFRKRALLEEDQLEDLKPNANQYPKQPVISKDKISSTYQKPKVNLRQKPLQLAKRILRKNGINKSLKLKCNSGKLTHNNQVNRSPKRLIISLNGESSSEESDDAEEVNTVPENPVASIEALISDCRQKSDSNEKNIEVVKHVPKALSCLSKAQQEEYNSLLKILAEKKKLPVSQHTFQHNNGAVRSALDDLKLLEEKLTKLKDTLKRKKLLMTNVSKDVDEKQQLYMKSKLSAQLLKEQYVAAEKVRRIKLDEWSKSCKNFEVVKKSVSSVESKIIQLQNLCSKLGSSVQGLTHNLSSLPINNGQL